MIAHWDDVEPYRSTFTPMRGDWYELGEAAGSQDIGVKRVEITPGRISTPPHVHAREEEIFYVLGGSGLLWQDGETCEVQPGDCIVHPPNGAAHTLLAGERGLDVLAFGPRLAPEAGYLPRSKNLWVAGEWAVRVLDHHPWDDEAALGMPEFPPPGERPANVVDLAGTPAEHGGVSHPLGRAAGATRTGLNHVALPPGAEGAAPHLHTVEEELFVILEGEGTLELWPVPSRGGGPPETHEVRAGHVIAHPPGGGFGHGLRAGPAGLTYLAYGTRSPADVTFYPRSNKIAFRGVGLTARLEHLEYGDGDPPA